MDALSMLKEQLAFVKAEYASRDYWSYAEHEAYKQQIATLEEEIQRLESGYGANEYVFAESYTDFQTGETTTQRTTFAWESEAARQEWLRGGMQGLPEGIIPTGSDINGSPAPIPTTLTYAPRSGPLRPEDYRQRDLLPPPRPAGDIAGALGGAGGGGIQGASAAGSEVVATIAGFKITRGNLPFVILGGIALVVALRGK